MHGFGRACAAPARGSSSIPAGLVAVPPRIRVGPIGSADGEYTDLPSRANRVCGPDEHPDSRSPYTLLASANNDAVMSEPGRASESGGPGPAPVEGRGRNPAPPPPACVLNSKAGSRRARTRASVCALLPSPSWLGAGWRGAAEVLTNAAGGTRRRAPVVAAWSTPLRCKQRENQERALQQLPSGSAISEI